MFCSYFKEKYSNKFTYTYSFLILPVNTFFHNFAQWRYSNQWSNREVLLLLVENYNQYPAQTEWNISAWGNFWRLLREQIYQRNHELFGESVVPDLRNSELLANGFGLKVAFKDQKNVSFLHRFFCLLLFGGTFTLVTKQAFLLFLHDDERNVSVQIMTDPDGPKTYGSQGPGSTSTTLLR